MRERAVVLGGGGHARVVLDILDCSDDVEIAGFTTPDARPDTLNGYGCLGTDSVLDALFDSGICTAFVAIGSNKHRKACLELVALRGFRLVNAISPRAVVSKYACLGRGIAIMPGAVINAGAQLGDGVIVNTNASVDHDCVIGACSHIGPGATVAGCVRVGEGSFLGSGSSVIPRINVGLWTTVGAGSVVVKDLPDHVVAFGVPATIRRETGGA